MQKTRKKKVKFDTIRNYYNINGGPFFVAITSLGNNAVSKVEIKPKVDDLPLSQNLMTIHKPRKVFIGKPVIGLGYEPGASVLIQLTNNHLIHVWETMVVSIPFDEKITSYYNPIHGTYIYPYATTESKKVIDFMGSHSPELHSPDAEALKFVNNCQDTFYNKWTANNEGKGKQLDEKVEFADVNDQILNAKKYTKYLHELKEKKI